jgi:type IV secretory pathway VirB10-like protein
VEQSTTKNSAAAIESPSGLDLNPAPERAIRVSKRAGIAVLCTIAAVVGLIAFGIYYRQQRQFRSPFSAKEEKTVSAATAAGKEIASEIPTGVVNLAAQEKRPESGTPTQPMPAKQVPEVRPLQSTSRAIVAAPPTPATTASFHDATPEERRLAAAYEREQEALIAPTIVRGDNAYAGSYSPTLQSSARPDEPAIANLTQALAARQSGSGSSDQGSPHTAYDEQNMQSQNEAFLAQSRSDAWNDYLKSTRTSPVSKYEIKAGWEIPAVLEQGLNSDLPGELKALVASNVYDTATGRYLLIPQGARLVGRYNSLIGYGQNGVQVVWNRIIFPDASSIDLDGMVGQDEQGYSGLRHNVDNHYKRLIGFAALTSLFSAGFQLSQSRTTSVLQYPSAGEVAGAAVGQQATQLGAEVTRRNLNIQPTIKIPVGYKFNVRVNRDMLFDAPYAPMEPKAQ